MRPKSPTARSARTSDPHPRAVLLDALGTLVTLDPPAPRLRSALAAEGHVHELADCERAMRAEIAHYKRNHLRGSDVRSLAELRRECAAVVAAELGPNTPAPGRMTDVLLDALRFRATPAASDCVRRLAAEGFRVAVVSNWDVSLAATMRSLGLDRHLAAVVTSAEVGFAKPHPAPFRAALAVVGVRPERALHCGDRPSEDGDGARAAGVRPVLLVTARGGPSSAKAIPTLDDLPRLADRLLPAAPGCDPASR